MGLWGGVPDAYADRVVTLVVQSMVDALDAADPVDLYVGTGAAENRNRRGWPLTDTAVTVLDARDPQGARMGTMAVLRRTRWCSARATRRSAGTGRAGRWTPPRPA